MLGEFGGAEHNWASYLPSSNASKSTAAVFFSRFALYLRSMAAGTMWSTLSLVRLRGMTSSYLRLANNRLCCSLSRKDSTTKIHFSFCLASVVHWKGMIAIINKEQSRELQALTITSKQIVPLWILVLSMPNYDDVREEVGFRVDICKPVTTILSHNAT